MNGDGTKSPSSVNVGSMNARSCSKDEKRPVDAKTWTVGMVSRRCDPVCPTIPAFSGERERERSDRGDASVRLQRRVRRHALSPCDAKSRRSHGRSPPRVRTRFHKWRSERRRRPHPAKDHQLGPQRTALLLPGRSAEGCHRPRSLERVGSLWPTLPEFVWRTRHEVLGTKGTSVACPSNVLPLSVGGRTRRVPDPTPSFARRSRPLQRPVGQRHPARLTRTCRRRSTQEASQYPQREESVLPK
jgi:hypothetical protein